MILSLLCLLSAPAQASSIFNPFDPIPTPPKEGVKSTFNLGFSFASGNKDQLGIKLAAGIKYQTERSNYRLVGSFNRSQTNNVQTAGSRFGHARGTTRFTGPLYGFVFTQVDSNVFRRVLLRSLSGAGLELRYYLDDWLSLTVASSLMGEYDRFDEGIIDSDTGFHYRNSSYLSAAIALGKQTTAGGTLFIQPRLDAFQTNYRTMAQATLVINLKAPPDINEEKTWRDRITKSSVKFNFRLDQDSEPPEGVEPTDIGVNTSFGLTFK